MEITAMKKTLDKRMPPEKLEPRYVPDTINYIKKTFPAKGSQKLDIRYLWGTFYRLNFWEKNQTGGKMLENDNIIVDSKFIKVTTDEEGNYMHKIYE